MTVIADERRCVELPTARPGDRFDLQFTDHGKIVLTLLDPKASVRANVSIEKREGYSVGILDRPIDEKALAEALNEFP